ncbi:ABC transporter substrate-binding protein [Paenibacillus frigoriresistens]|uniref:ABC transporter substrate-binding protein n=1 Tax=Paenibacillus alginolyticus TaxID=59839 RepID=UPI0015658DBA|nr:ABC transporter substrate-binding protein [Paenibacillus frigoriresistens]NRF94413.1 ABC transporter substrate-binding protein [Paenibacillus frigoriresistens]
MKKWAWTSLFLSLVLFFTACSSKPAVPSPSAAPASSASAATAATGGELIVAAEQDPVGFDPHKVPADSSVRIYSLIFDSLTKLDEKLNVVPSLADSWKTADDGKSITFNLHKGVKFHNGREMTSDDVKYSFERILNKDTGALAKSYFSSIDTIETPDANTVVFKLKTPDSAFAANTASAFASIVPKEVVDLNKEPIGTGPYKMDKNESGQFVTLKKNPDHFNKDLGKVDTIKFQIMKDEAERLAAIRAGKVDLALVSADTAKLLGSNKNVTVKGFQTLQYSYLGINVKKKPFDDPRVREALSYAVDRKQIVDTVWKSQAVPSGPVSPALSWAVDTNSYATYKTDIAKAKQLLADAGYPNGFDTVIETASTYPDMVDTAQVLQQQLKAVGINVKINQLEWGNYVKTWSSKDMTLLVGRNTAGAVPDRAMRFYFGTTGSANVWNYSNPKYDEVLQNALESNDQTQIKQLYDESQKILVQDAPNLFLASPKNFYAMNEKVQGFEPTAAGEYFALVKTSMKK